MITFKELAHVIWELASLKPQGRLAIQERVDAAALSLNVTGQQARNSGRVST